MRVSHQGFLLLATALLSQARTTPNIVFILTDDQDVLLGGMTPLTAVKRLLADEGTTFARAFATTPLCCPSRSSILTGLYLHSHGVVNNSLSGGCSSRGWQSRREGGSFARVAHDAGYRTFYAGKYLNQYGRGVAGGVAHIPRGWDWWIGLVGNSAYYNYTLSVNGTAVRRGDREGDYLTDVLRDYSMEFLRDVGSSRPFLMVIAPPAPHEPFTPAERHRGRFSGRRAPRTPSFNFPANGTKHWLLRLPPEVLPPETIDSIDDIFRRRWETLLSVDELVETIVSRLGQLSLLNDTYVMLSSDNGFHLGQFGLPWDKRQPYETDIRIPVVLRGPEVAKGVVSYTPVLTIDFAATILDMARLGVKSFGDGRSFLREGRKGGVSGRRFWVEYRGEGGGGGDECNGDPEVKLCLPQASCKCFDARNNTYRCVRRVFQGVDDVLCVFEDGESFEEYYDIRKDPYQVRNLAVKNLAAGRQ